MKLYNHSLQAQNQTGDVGYTSVGHFQVSLVKDDETVQAQFTSSKPNRRCSLHQCGHFQVSLVKDDETVQSQFTSSRPNQKCSLWAVFYFHEEHPVLVLKNKLELSWFQFHT